MVKPYGEAELSSEVARMAKEMGILETKLDGGQGWPDRVFVCPNGRVGFIEFKSPTGLGRLSQLQKFRQEQLKVNNANVLTSSNIEECAQFLKALCEVKAMRPVEGVWLNREGQ